MHLMYAITGLQVPAILASLWPTPLLINLPQKRLDVEPSRRDRSHRIVGHPLRIDPVAHPCRITSQRPQGSVFCYNPNVSYVQSMYNHP